VDALADGEEFAMTTALLELQGLTCHFGGLHAVSELDMQLPRGQITALIGPNGAGKSTVINLLCGFLVPTSGRVLLKGNDVTGQPPHRLAEAGLVRTFQNGRLFARLTVFQNALVGNSSRAKAGLFDIILRNKRFRTEERTLEERAREYLHELDLLAEADRAVTELPYGKQRQVELVRALVGAPEIMLLDEPAAGLNSAERGSLTAYLRGLRAKGMTILLVEHHMGMVMQLADHVVVLNFGKKIFEGTAAQTQSSPVVAEAYLGRRARHAVM
jgi:branched-chain amino acid transport system ATP-binding protein